MATRCAECGIDKEAVRDWLALTVGLLTIIKEKNLVSLAPEMKPVLEALGELTHRFEPYQH